MEKEREGKRERDRERERKNERAYYIDLYCIREKEIER